MGRHSWFRRAILAGLVAGLAGAVGASAAEGSGGTHYVNLSRLYNEFYKTKLAQAQINSQSQELTAEQKKMDDELTVLNNEFTALRDEAQNPASTVELRAQKRALAEEKLLAIRDLEQRKQKAQELSIRTLASTYLAMRQRLLNEILETVKSHALKKGYDAVLEMTGSTLHLSDPLTKEPFPFRGVVYAASHLDITDEILKILNANDPQATAAAPAAP